MAPAVHQKHQQEESTVVLVLQEIEEAHDAKGEDEHTREGRGHGLEVRRAAAQQMHAGLVQASCPQEAILVAARAMPAEAAEQFEVDASQDVPALPGKPKVTTPRDPRPGEPGAATEAKLAASTL